MHNPNPNPSSNPELRCAGLSIKPLQSLPRPCPSFSSSTRLPKSKINTLHPSHSHPSSSSPYHAPPRPSSPVYSTFTAPQPSGREERMPWTRPAQRCKTSWLSRRRGCRRNGHGGATSRRSTLTMAGARVGRPGVWITRSNTRKKKFSLLHRWVCNHVCDPSRRLNANIVAHTRSTFNDASR